MQTLMMTAAPVLNGHALPPKHNKSFTLNNIPFLHFNAPFSISDSFLIYPRSMNAYNPLNIKLMVKRSVVVAPSFSFAEYSRRHTTDVAILGMQTTVGFLVAKALTSSENPYQGLQASYSPILALDVFLVQASANTILSRFLGLVFSLELLRSVKLPTTENIPG